MVSHGNTPLRFFTILRQSVLTSLNFTRAAMHYGQNAQFARMSNDGRCLSYSAIQRDAYFIAHDGSTQMFMQDDAEQIPFGTLLKPSLCLSFEKWGD